MTKANSKFDIYATITDRICAELEKGNIPWQKPWFAAVPSAEKCAISGSTGKPYSLLNQMLLGRTGRFFTFKQVDALKAKVRKGEKASMVVFWKMYPKKEVNDAGETEESVIPVLKYFNVFHESQIDGLPESITPELIPLDPHEEAERIINGYLERETNLKLNRDDMSNEAFYSPFFDSITVPHIAQYERVEEYYSTLFHEMVHSTGHKSRLDRLNSKAHFGNEEYSKEELVAELGAASLVNISGLESAKSFKNSAAYVQNWLHVLKDDKRLIVSAASKAEKAVNLILGK